MSYFTASVALDFLKWVLPRHYPILPSWPSFMHANVLASVYLFVCHLCGLSAVSVASSACCGINEVVDLAACVGS